MTCLTLSNVELEAETFVLLLLLSCLRQLAVVAGVLWSQFVESSTFNVDAGGAAEVAKNDLPVPAQSVKMFLHGIFR